MARSVLFLALVWAAGCSGGGWSDDPLTYVRDPTNAPASRARAVDAAWRAGLSGQESLGAVRKTLKDLAWSPATPTGLRLAALDALLSDTEPGGAADTRELVRLMLPRERSRGVAARLAETVAERGWREMTPALVRRYAKFEASVPDAERPELEALKRLHPDVEVQEVVFGVFLDPATVPGPYQVRWDERTRADAWDLLTRLDPTGEYRWAFLNGASADAAAGASGKIVEDLRAALRELRALPVTSEELRWLASLRDPERAENAVWWREASAAIGSLSPEANSRLALRHAEAIRWASRHSPELIGLTRWELLTRLQERLSGRKLHPRSSRVSSTRRPVREKLDDWIEQMSWADALTVLVVDEALRSGGMAGVLFEFARLDHLDTTTEYGGVIDAVASEDGAFEAVLFPPRARDRTTDNAFVASEDMIRASDRSLAHFHLQVQDLEGRSYAGPSIGDLRYAARSGRTCLVLSSVDADTLNADYYQADGVIIDLGEVERPR